MPERGKYLIFEGHDATGKSTQVDIARAKLKARGINSVKVEEPAGAPIADELRTIIKDGDLERDGLTNLLLFTAARHEICRQTIEPALEEGTWVVAARNWVSTLAYQGMGESIDEKRILDMTREFTGESYFNPAFFCVLVVRDEIERKRRIMERGKLEKPDAFESRDAEFQERVHEGYLSVVESQGLRVIDASPPAEEVGEEVWSHIEPLTEAA